MNRTLKLTLAALTLAVTAAAHPATLTHTSGLFTFPAVGADGAMVPPMPVAGGWAVLETSGGGARQAIHATGLPAGHAMTSWWVVFNHPERCSGGVCDEDDVFEHPELAHVSLLYGDGQVVDERGHADFYAYLAQGDTTGAVFGPGLVHTHSAEIHFVLRSHGRAVDRHVAAQLG